MFSQRRHLPVAIVITIAIILPFCAFGSLVMWTMKKGAEYTLDPEGYRSWLTDTLGGVTTSPPMLSHQDAAKIGEILEGSQVPVVYWTGATTNFYIPKDVWEAFVKAAEQVPGCNPLMAAVVWHSESPSYTNHTTENSAGALGQSQAIRSTFEWIMPGVPLEERTNTDVSAVFTCKYLNLVGIFDDTTLAEFVDDFAIAGGTPVWNMHEGQATYVWNTYNKVLGQIPASVLTAGIDTLSQDELNSLDTTNAEVEAKQAEADRQAEYVYNTYSQLKDNLTIAGITLEEDTSFTYFKPSFIRKILVSYLDFVGLMPANYSFASMLPGETQTYTGSVDVNDPWAFAPPYYQGTWESPYSPHGTEYGQYAEDISAIEYCNLENGVYEESQIINISSINGIVTEKGWSNGNPYIKISNQIYKEVLIMHGVYTVSVGQHVSVGEIIGTEANVGNSTGCHTHWNVRMAAEDIPEGVRSWSNNVFPQDLINIEIPEGYVPPKQLPSIDLTDPAPTSSTTE